MRRDPYGYGGAVAAVLCTSVNDKESFKLSMKGGYRYVRTYNELYSIVCLIRTCGKHYDRNMQQYTSQKTLWTYCSVIASLHNFIALFCNAQSYKWS